MNPNSVGSLKSGSEIIVDATLPEVLSVTSTSANKTYKKGDIIDISVNFSKNVKIDGTATLSLDTGGEQSIHRLAFSGDNEENKDFNIGDAKTPKSLNFKYVVKEGDYSEDLNYSNNAPYVFGEILDWYNNEISLVLPDPSSSESLAETSDIIIDAIVPEPIPLIASEWQSGTWQATDLGKELGLVIRRELQKDFSQKVIGRQLKTQVLLMRIKIMSHGDGYI